LQKIKEFDGRVEKLFEEKFSDVINVISVYGDFLRAVS